MYDTRSKNIRLDIGNEDVGVDISNVPDKNEEFRKVKKSNKFEKLNQ